MFGFIRLILILLVALTVVYAAVSLYSREMRRLKLKQRWKEKGLTGDRAAFIQRGLIAIRQLVPAQADPLWSISSRWGRWRS